MIKHSLLVLSFTLISVNGFADTYEKVSDSHGRIITSVEKTVTLAQLQLEKQACQHSIDVWTGKLNDVNNQIDGLKDVGVQE